jgi:hypothetical protein
VTRSQSDVEKKAVDLITPTPPSSSTSGSSKRALKKEEQDGLTAAIALLGDFHEKSAISVREAWWAFFWEAVGKYRDQMM